MSRRFFNCRSLLVGAFVIAGPAFADNQNPPTNTEELPNILIVQVPEVGDSQDLSDQRTDTDVSVFPLRVELQRLEDGTFDMDNIRAQILVLMQEAQPITVKISDPDQAFASLTPDLQEAFTDAEADSVAANDMTVPAVGEVSKVAPRAVVAWRGYGPAGAGRGVVAFNRTPYRGYAPYPRPYIDVAAYIGNPYYGYYANNRNYPFMYAAHRSTPSYHYFGYVRGY